MKNKRFFRGLAFLLATLMLLVSLPVIPAVAQSTKEFSLSFDGKTVADVVSGKYPNSAQIVAAADGAHGDVLQLGVKPQPNAAYYLWKDSNNKWAIENATVGADGKVSGSANGVTVTNATVNTVSPLDASTKINDTYYVVSGDYADAYGGAGTMATPFTLKNPAFSAATSAYVVVELDLFFSADFKNSSGVSGRVRTSGGSIELFEIKSSANGATIAQHENGINISGAATELALGKWHHVAFMIDMENALRYVYVNGAMTALQRNNDRNVLTTPLSITANTLSVQIDRGGAVSSFGGAVQMDNIAMYTAERDVFAFYKNDFEGETVGAAPANGFHSIAVTGSTVKNDYGSKAWSIPINTDNVDKNPKVTNPAISYETTASIVYETDLFIPSGTYGRLQSQVYNPTAFAGADATEAGKVGNGWVDLYTVTMDEGRLPLLALEGGTANGSASLDNDRWNKISLVLDLVNCTKKIYLNGDKIIEAALDTTAEYRNLTILENSLIVIGKINKNRPSYTGEIRIDNIKLFAGISPSVLGESTVAQTFDAFSYVAAKNALPAATLPSYPSSASLAQKDGGYALHMSMAAAASDASYALLSANGRSVLSWDFDWNPDSPYTGKIGTTDYTVAWENSLGLFATTYDGQLAYVVSDAVAETATGSSNATLNVAKALKYRHATYSYATSSKIMLEARYFIEEGSSGVIESQFESYAYGEEKTAANWIQLYTIDTATGRFDGTHMFLNVGEWNDVKVILNLAAGTYDMYVNGVWAKNESVGNTNLTLGASSNEMWSVAKVQRTTAPASKNGTGGIYVDDIRVTEDVATSTSKLGSKFLTDEAFTSWMEGVLSMVDGASVRVTDPSGLRFAAELESERYAHLTSMLGTSVLTGGGVIIAPRDYVEEAGGCTKEKLEKLSHTVNYAEAKYDGALFDGTKAGLGDGAYIAGSIVNLKDGNVTREFAASAYVEFTIGSTVYTFTTENVTYRSVQGVAKSALADRDAIWRVGELAILKAYANGVNPD